MNIAYGIQIEGFNDPYVATIQESVDGLNIAGIPGSFLVDLIPALKYVPSWFPGAGFKKKAAYYAKVNQKVVELPFNHVAQQMVNTLVLNLSCCYHVSEKDRFSTIEGGHGRSKFCRVPDHCSSRRR
jgi:hypothetical protein